MTTWQKVETFHGDEYFESPVLTYGGVVTIHLNPHDAEGNALSLRVASDERTTALIDLTLEEADGLASWLRIAIDAIGEMS